MERCATIEAVLLMSAAQIAGPKQQRKKTDREIAYHGSQAGRVALAASIREKLEEMLTINRLSLPSVLRRYLGTPNIIDNGHSAARDRMRRVKNWPSGSMALRVDCGGVHGLPRTLREVG
jgi:hypothetical protein